MLVLERKINEDIEIRDPAGNRILIRLVEIKSSKKARIGITAPQQHQIIRPEILNGDKWHDRPKRRKP